MVYNGILIETIGISVMVSIGFYFFLAVSNRTVGEIRTLSSSLYSNLAFAHP